MSQLGDTGYIQDSGDMVDIQGFGDTEMYTYINMKKAHLYWTL